MPNRTALGLAAALIAACGASNSSTEPASAGAPGASSAAAAAPFIAPTGRVHLGTVYVLPGKGAAATPAPTQPGDLEVPGLGSPGIGERGGGTGQLRLRRPAGPQVRPGVPNTTGQLDRAIIQRVIRQSLGRVKDCFAKELARDPNLAGTLVVRFTIEASGSVSQAVATGVTASVSNCVAAVIQRLAFPAPPGGGRVMVSYPFVFGSSAGAIGPNVSIGDRLQEVPRGCYPLDTGGGASAFEPIERAATACYQEALGRVPSLMGRARVELLVDAQGAIGEVAVTGPGDSTLEACIAEATRALSLTGDQRVAVTGKGALFTLAFTREPMLALERDPEAALVTLSRPEVRVGLRIVGSEVGLDRDAAPHQAVWGEIHTAVRGLKGPIVLRVADDVDSLVVEMALRTLNEQRTQLRLARAVSDAADGWKVVTPLADFDLTGPCDGPPHGRNSVVVARDGYWIGTDKGYAHIPLDGKTADSIGFARHLRELRRFELAARSDLEIAATPGTPYEALVKAVDIAFETGFTEVRVMRPSELRDPRHLRRR
ncbi:MAG TPA: AgmX/PglI C-terminal domain-containing protein [Kofleriaceae bacterium]|nr:AgmX/PglI C-terminal domain-containing protein [Kofleriaceae bacterium]